MAPTHMGLIKTFKDVCGNKELSGHLGGGWILDCAAGEAQGRGPSSTPKQQSPTEQGGLKLGSWGPLAKQQQLHLGRSFPQHEMGVMPHEQGWGLPAHPCSWGSSAGGNCKAFTAV